MNLPNLDLEDLWQAVRCRFRGQREPATRIGWAFYRVFYRAVRAILFVGARD